MKIEQLIVQYLYHNKNVSIQDIGKFVISPDVIIPGEKDRDTILPEGAIQFHYNPREQKDEELIDYIVDQTGKIRFLAMSDLESYSNLSRQFLNIGKPMEIPGLGSLQKSQDGTYEFLQSRLMQNRFEKKQKLVEEKKADDISFATPSKNRKSNSGVMITIILLFLLATSAAAYYLLKNDDGNELVQEDLFQKQGGDSFSLTSTAVAVTNSTVQDSSEVASPTTAVNDGFNFKVVLKQYSNKPDADRAFAKLTSYGHNLVMTQADSSSFLIMMPFKSPLSDTMRAKDSLRKFFGGSPYVKLQ